MHKENDAATLYTDGHRIAVVRNQGIVIGCRPELHSVYASLRPLKLRVVDEFIFEFPFVVRDAVALLVLYKLHAEVALDLVVSQISTSIALTFLHQLGAFASQDLLPKVGNFGVIIFQIGAHQQRLEFFHLAYWVERVHFPADFLAFIFSLPKQVVVQLDVFELILQILLLLQQILILTALYSVH